MPNEEAPAKYPDKFFKHERSWPKFKDLLNSLKGGEKIKITFGERAHLSRGYFPKETHRPDFSPVPGAPVQVSPGSRPNPGFETVAATFDGPSDDDPSGFTIQTKEFGEIELPDVEKIELAEE